MIQTYSSSIRRKEMDAVLTCMVDEKIGPGEMNLRLVQSVKEFFGVDGAVALRSPAVALKYAFQALDLPAESGIILSALAPAWQLAAVKDLGYKPVILDVNPDTALVTAAAVEDGIRAGGRLLLLSETAGTLPDMEEFVGLGIPVIEDISQSIGAYRDVPGSDGETGGEIRKAGTYGVFSILGLEERDLITGGGGAVLMAPSRREWIVLKRLIEEASPVDILPDLNSALAYIQMKEFPRNEHIRQDIFAAYQKALMSSRHKTFMRAQNGVSAAYTFPVILNSGFKDVKQYAARKDIEIQSTFTGTIADVLQDDLENCIQARSLLLRCASFPLYPRLGNSQIASVIKVLGTLP